MALEKSLRATGSAAGLVNPIIILVDGTLIPIP